MIYEKDWFMRQIKMMVNFIVKLVLKKDPDSYSITETNFDSDTNLIYGNILDLLSQKKINEAENLLFEELDTGNLSNLEIALDFYSRVNEFSDEELENSGFSRNEIKSGISDIINKFGYAQLFETLFDIHQ